MTDLKGKMFVCFGDSITSDEVTGTGTRIAELSQMELLGNFAHGNATASDWHSGDNILTRKNLDLPVNEWFADNTLSNQIFKFLDVKDSLPDIIYIAIGINDGRVEAYGDMTPVFDNCSNVFGKPLTRIGIASALVWAVETLKRECPKAEIFAASPLQNSWTIEPGAFSESVVLTKREIIKKVCGFCKIRFIDSYEKSGFTREIAALHGDGVHPDEEYREKIAHFVIDEIKKAIN